MVNPNYLKLKCGGYTKIEKFVNELASNNFAIITDLSMDQNIFDNLKSKVGENYLWLDHHEASTDAMLNGDKTKIKYDIERAASLLCFEKMLEYVSPKCKNALNILSIATNAYDLWKKDTEAFKVGYALNELFWKMNFWNFAKRFNDGFVGFSKYEKQYLRQATIKKDQIFKDSISTKIISNNYDCLLFVPSDPSIMNDVSLRYGDDHDLMFIVNKYPNNINVSVRAGNDMPHLDLSTLLPLLIDHPKVISAGGHAAAGGINCSTDLTIEDVDVLAQAVCENILPF